MKYREVLEIAKKYPNCCKGSCSGRKCNKSKLINIAEVKKDCETDSKKTSDIS